MSVKKRIKAKAKATKDRLVAKLKGVAARKARASRDARAGRALWSTVLGLAALCAGSMLALCGCQQLTPAARSNSTKYGDIVRVDAGGYVGSITVTIGDGTLASADGGGDTQSNTPTQDIRPQTQLTYGIGTGGGSTWGDFFSALSKLFSGGGAASPSPTPAASGASASGASGSGQSCESCGVGGAECSEPKQ